MLRGVAEYLSRGKELKRTLPSHAGGFRILVSPEAGGLRFWRRDLGKADPELIRLAREFVQPGFVVWDVGASQGMFAFPAARRAGPKGRVIAIEPDVRLARLLRKSCAMSAQFPRAQVTVVPLAASDSNGPRVFRIARRARASNHLDGFGNSNTRGARESHLVLAVTPDWLAQCFPPPQVLKIDVEEAELCVLRKASTILREHRPVLICEVNARNSVAGADVLRSLRYAIYHGPGGRPAGESLRPARGPLPSLRPSWRWTVGCPGRGGPWIIGARNA